MRFGCSTNFIIPINFVVGGDVLDAPCPRKCYFITISDSRGRLSLQAKKHISVGEGFPLPRVQDRHEVTFA